MDRKSCLKEITQIEKELSSSNMDLDTIVSKLNELYCYKPVSMNLLALYSRVLLMKNEPDEVVRRYSDCYAIESKNEQNLMLWNNVIEAYERIDRVNDAKWNSYMKSRLLDDSFYKKEDERLRTLRQQFIDGDETHELLKKLEQAYYFTGDFLMAFSIRMYMSISFGEEQEQWEKYMSCANIMYLKERIDAGITIIIVNDEKNSVNYDILAYIYHKLKLPVYIISEPISMNEEFDLQASVQVSMDNKQEFEDSILIPSISQCNDETYVGDNIPYLIDAICMNMTENDFALVIASNSNLEKMRSFADIAKRFERLSDYYATYLEDKVGFGWCGDYYKYIGYLYNMDVRSLVERTPEVKYSIVVPVRNATETLYHTLRTCIEQDYDGSYEVVLSDNSIDGHSVAYETFKKLDSDKIKYYKTPRDLNLTKSYEYAYLQTKGKYIFSIGADDGVFPWALKRLDFAWDKNSPERNVMCWDRGFYAWPGFNGGQENQFDIPLCYNNEIKGFVNASTEYIKLIKESPDRMYSLPNMYLNSGFKREYMKKIFDMTGRLWDGYAQDIYTGMQNLMLEKDFLYIKYPITLAGMSSASTGALCRDSSLNNNKQNKVELLYGGKSIYKIIKTVRDALIPEMGTDISGLYICTEHLISKGILPQDFYESDKEIEHMYIKCFESLSLLSDKFYKFVYEGYEAAKRRSDNMAIWYEQTIMASCNKNGYYDKQKIDKAYTRKTYVEGFNTRGGVTLDASRFGVTNIYEAVQLFKDFLHF